MNLINKSKDARYLIEALGICSYPNYYLDANEIFHEVETIFYLFATDIISSND